MTATAILSRIASIHNPTTKTHATELIRAARADKLSLPVGKVPELVAQLLAVAHKRGLKRNERAILRSKVAHAPVRTLAERLGRHKAVKDKIVKDAVRLARKGLYRIASDAGKYAPKSGHTTIIQIGEPGVRGVSKKVWGTQWAATSSQHTYTVGRDWIETVQDRGLAVVDGLFTLSATPIQGHGPELFAALWVEQGRGCTLNQERGYIARTGETTYHAKTARAALDGVQRKAGLKPKRRQGVIDLDKLARRHGDLPVYFSDSRDAGNCDSGTRSWCNAVGISPTGCTLAEVVAGYKLRPLPGALAVIRRVVKDRHNRQPIDLSAINGAAKLLSDGRIVFDSEGGFRVEAN